MTITVYLSRKRFKNLGTAKTWLGTLGFRYDECRILKTQFVFTQPRGNIGRLLSYTGKGIRVAIRPG